MPDVSTGYVPGPGGFYLAADRSGPYSIDSAGNATLLNSISSSPLPNGTDRSSTIATGGQYQTLAASNPARKSLVGQNLSTGDLWINESGGNAAADTPGSYRVAAGQAFSVGTSRAISIVGATTGQKFTATET